GSVAFSGTVNSSGQFNLTGQGNFTVVGIVLNPRFTLTNTQLTIAVSAAIPVVGTANFSGTVNTSGNFTVTASSANLTLRFVTPPHVSAALSNSPLSLPVQASATGIPLIGSVTFVGTISGGNISFSVTLPSVTVLGFTIRNVSATLVTSPRSA